MSEFCSIEGVFTYTRVIPDLNCTLYINGESLDAVCWSYKAISETEWLRIGKRNQQKQLLAPHMYVDTDRLPSGKPTFQKPPRFMSIFVLVHYR
jgi:hypothetical protein